MKLIRGWESRYVPNETGGLRLSKARLFRKFGEEGLGDSREGEIRVIMPGRIKSSGGPVVDVTIQLEDQPVEYVKDLQPGEARKFKTESQVGDAALDSPFLFCLSREPATVGDWEALRAALPERYDTWTITDDVVALKFEIECGIKRWMALNDITQHWIKTHWGWVTYSYDTFPPSVEPSNLGQVLEARWFRKSKRYSGQQEYRLMWSISSPQGKAFPDAIDIELTKTGLALFKPWNPQY